MGKPGSQRRVSASEVWCWKVSQLNQVADVLTTVVCAVLCVSLCLLPSDTQTKTALPHPVTRTMWNQVLFGAHQRPEEWMKRRWNTDFRHFIHRQWLRGTFCSLYFLYHHVYYVVSVVSILEPGQRLRSVKAEQNVTVPANTRQVQNNQAKHGGKYDFTQKDKMWINAVNLFHIIWFLRDIWPFFDYD